MMTNKNEKEIIRLKKIVNSVEIAEKTFKQADVFKHLGRITTGDIR